MAKKNPPQKVAIRNNTATPSTGGKTKAATPKKSKNPARKMAKTTVTAKPKAKQERAPFIAPETPHPALLPTKTVLDEVSYAPKSIPHGAPLSVSVQSAQGTAAHGNAHPANLLVVVTCAGWPVTELSKDHFTLMEHFEVPGQTAPFSNNITSFRNAGTGAYLLQIRPINGAPWHSGHHLGQILISTDRDQQGQAAFKLIIR